MSGRILVLLLVTAGGCASLPPVEQWGRDCRSEMDPARRLELVRKIISTGDERAIPILIDCLESFKRLGKKPDRLYGGGMIEPNVTAPAEFWGLYIVTRMDYDLDVDKWRAWYELHEGQFVWDGGTRRFILK